MPCTPYPCRWRPQLDSPDLRALCSTFAGRSHHPCRPSSLVSRDPAPPAHPVQVFPGEYTGLLQGLKKVSAEAVTPNSPHPPVDPLGAVAVVVGGPVIPAAHMPLLTLSGVRPGRPDQGVAADPDRILHAGHVQVRPL